ncbi:MAG: dienelactone hydrolase family protein [Verrucomicrobia bacterium]|nr:dienelactone hydrolase family protein [Verrucomicrobiota bacterium]MDA1086020.1 dienelactone hydrolase family protein [Verrucomicrobiota bacterium]
MNTRTYIPLLAAILITSNAAAELAPRSAAEPVARAPSAPPLHHGLVQKKLGFYAVYLPPDYTHAEARDKRYPVCVILHGHGSTETGHGSLSDPLGRDGVIYIAPRAAYPHEGVFMRRGEPGWTAWPTYPEAWGDFTGADYPLEHLGDIDLERLHSDWIADCIRDVTKRYRTDDRKVVVVGHSQGAAWAHKVAVHHPSLVRSYFAYAGHYPEEFRTEAVAESMKQHKIAPVILHHAADTLVEKEATQVFLDFLEKHEVPHTGSILPGGTHALDIDIIERMRAYVDEQCR